MWKKKVIKVVKIVVEIIYGVIVIIRVIFRKDFGNLKEVMNVLCDI